jgi:hypothetical protein
VQNLWMLNWTPVHILPYGQTLDWTCPNTFGRSSYTFEPGSNTEPVRKWNEKTKILVHHVNFTWMHLPYPECAEESLQYKCLIYTWTNSLVWVSQCGCACNETWWSGPLLCMACTSPLRFHWFLFKMQ